MHDIKDKNTHPDFLTSEGQLGEMIRHFNWSATSLGPLSHWPQSLKTTINLMLNSKNPIWIGWGPDNTFLYNDAYIDVLGIDKHRWALGKPASVVWEEIWDICGPLSDKVYKESKSTNNDDVHLFMKRGSFLEEVFYSFSYSPIFDEFGKVAGLFCPNFETTGKVLNARRSLTLAELAAKSLIEKTVGAAFESAAATIQKNNADIPFALFYLLNSEGKKVNMVQQAGIEFTGSEQFPKEFTLKSEIQLTTVIKTGKWQTFELQDNELLIKGQACQPVTNAIALLLTTTVNKAAGILVCGINPTRRLDKDYMAFYEAVAANISAAIQNVDAIDNERKRLEELAKIDRAKTAFVSNISHEFRTPLTLMLGPLEELTTNHDLDGHKKEIAETVHRNALRLLKLVNTLLDFSLMESGKFRARFTPVDLASVTENLASNFSSITRKAGLEFIVKASPLSQPVYIDRDMWEKIVFNLLSNAFKYTLNGSITVTITQDTNNAILTVSDTGLGIPKGEMYNMFSRFHRIRNAGGRSYEGSGIGLSMIKELILQHGGSISVESTEGKGSTFSVAIPFGKAHLDIENVYEEMQEMHANPINHYLTEADAMADMASGTFADINMTPQENVDTILVADDNADMRRHLTSILSKEYRVITVANGAEALDAIYKERPSLLLSDVMMPVMDGKELLRQIKSDPEIALLPIIFLTARAGEESKIEGYETGADDYLVKPFSAKELLARIRSQIKIIKARDNASRQIKNLFLQAPVAICVLRGRNLIVEIANENMLKLWNKTAEVMINRPLFEGLPEAAVQGFDKKLANSYNNGKEYIEEESHFYSVTNGITQEIFVKFIYQPILQEDGEVKGIVVLAHDITPQVIARKKIEESESKFRTLVKLAPVSIIILKGKDLVYDTANDVYLGIHNLKREDVLGKKIFDLFPHFKDHPIGIDMRYVFETGNTVHRPLRPVEFNYNGVKRMRYFTSAYQPLMENGVPAGVISMVTEITEQYLAQSAKEQSAKDLKMILETMPQITFTASPDGMIKYFNDRYFDYTGLTPEQAKGMGWKPVIHPDMLDVVYSNWMRAMQTGEKHNDIFLLKRKDGVYRWHMSRTIALLNENGGITEWVGTLTDIHDQKKFEEELEAMVNDRTQKLNTSNKLLALKNIELEKTNKELESFNYVASHDLQEPLRKIQTFISTIQEWDLRGEAAQRYMDKIFNSAARMSQLIQDVLMYSRISEENQFVETNLNTIINNVLADYELLISEKKAVIIKDDLPNLMAVPLQMHQLFSNLISNALKYSSDAPVIEIKGEIVEHETDQGKIIDCLQITFSDNGIGFEEQYSEQIFKLFQRLHAKTEYTGTGIGLSICKKIIEQHKGTITAHSALGEGATFIMKIPV
ncbi:ATP-binding protein [Flavobacterium sp. DG1-102-2]|uniref:ATP-binding protein n=1 Tax=Flavobacterium sp. DG1-102-2 TaxID=3081663 RepID=UPI002949C681|nr:ATP-binding protein [Flavobacterium sp. DG1-102-2]MDV6168623.1 ATP-binding protein [Flavobacterium sp. DG1-102-2]